jgi:signal transduction histidine kinase
LKTWFRHRPIRVRITLAFLLAMAVLLLASGAFIYERMQFALDRSIRDVPHADKAEIVARRQHRNEALDELLAQLAVAYGATLAIAGLVGYRMTRAALDPVEVLQRQASATPTSRSPIQLRVPDTDDELSRLATTLNTLLASTQRAVEHERQFIADASHELRTRSRSSSSRSTSRSPATAPRQISDTHSNASAQKPTASSGSRTTSS